MNTLERHYEYYEYDGIFHRVTYNLETGKPEKAEGYFKGNGFADVELYPIIREGEFITEKDFKAAVVAERR